MEKRYGIIGKSLPHSYSKIIHEHLFNKKYDWELTRVCNKKDYNIVGASQKQFYYFVNKFNPKSILSYVDRRYYNGEIQKELGFELTKTIKPTKLVLLNKSSTLIPLKFLSKKYLKKHLKAYDVHQSLRDNLQSNKCYIVCDCGKFLFVKNFTSSPLQ